jgi:Haem-NO-binding
MKGHIFTELVRFMEETISPAFADQVIREADIPSDGAYTSVGNYPSEEALTLVGKASEISGIAADELCRMFGAYLFERFMILYPHIMSAYKDAGALLQYVDGHIHNEVKILYPDAKTPKVIAETKGDTTTVTYSSHRPMAALAHGLVEQCMKHFDDKRSLTWEVSNDGRNASFYLVGNPSG